MKLMRILKYNVLNAPGDFSNFMDTKKGKIVALSILYMAAIVLMTYGLYKLAMFEVVLLIVLYVLSLLAGSLIITNRKFRCILCLDKKPWAVSTQLFCVLTGPYALIKFGYILSCLLALSRTGESARLITTFDPREFNRHDKADHPLIDSVVKFQKRLRDYS